jgi:hypothetical protein
LPNSHNTSRWRSKSQHCSLQTSRSVSNGAHILVMANVEPPIDRAPGMNDFAKRAAD